MTGKAEWWEHIANGIWAGDPKKHHGLLDGNIDGDRFNAQISWNSDRGVDIYTGQIGPNGRIEGETYDRARPNNRATWYSSSPLRCAEQQALIQPRYTWAAVRPLGQSMLVTAKFEILGSRLVETHQGHNDRRNDIAH
jgi:hypothetical protein